MSFEGEVRVFNAIGWGSALKEVAHQLRIAGQEEYVAEGIIKPFSQALEAPKTLMAPALSVVLMALCDLRVSEPAVDEELKRVAQDGHILHQLGSVKLEEMLSAARDVSEARKGNKPLPEESSRNPTTKAVAWCMYVYLHYFPHPSQPPDIGEARHGYEHLKKILAASQGFYDFPSDFVDVLKQYNEVAVLNTIFENEPSAKPFVLLCLERMEESDYQDVISATLRASLKDKKLVPEF